MSQIDILKEVTKVRLEQWGLEYALDRDVTGTGYSSTNILHKMMRHGMVARGINHETAADAQEIELIVTQLARRDMRVVCCLRGYFCGSMRRKVERFDQALGLAAKHHIKRFSLRTYLYDVELGSSLVRMALANGGRVPVDNFAPSP